MQDLGERMPVERDTFLDNLKGVLIFLVVFAHYLVLYVEQNVASPAVQTLCFFIYSFHMPLFVFVSGFFSKDVDKARETAFARLLLPYFFFNTIMSLYAYATDLTSFCLLTPVYVNWYLLALFVWRILLKDLIKIRGVLPFSFVAGLFIGFLPEATNLLAISRVICFLPFFLLGYYTSAADLLRVKRISKVVAVIGLLLAFAALYLFTKSGLLNMGLYTAELFSSSRDIYLRALFFVCSVLISVCVICLCPTGHKILLTRFGAMSFLVFVLHRYFSLVFNEIVPASNWRDIYVFPIFVLSLLTTAVLAMPVLTETYNNLRDGALKIINSEKRSSRLSRTEVRALIIVFLLIDLVVICYYFKDHKSHMVMENSGAEVLHPVLSSDTLEKLESSITVSFVGDLLLLEDQVKRNLDPSGKFYNFAPVFEYVRDDLKEADYAIGVLEVPVAGSSLGYSTSNFDDGIPLLLNAPDAWASDIKASGIDLVTTANNHAFDKGEQGMLRTLDLLDEVGLAHLGTYRGSKEREGAFLVEVRGLKIAFLAYTDYMNNYEQNTFANENSHYVTVLASPSDKVGFERSKKIVREDIKRAKQKTPDLIISLPHMGTQFSHHADDFSRIWAHEMIKEGVDVVFAAASHAVQPIEEYEVLEEDGQRRLGVIFYSPGNFVNSYTDYDGDAAAIVNVHLDPTKGKKRRILAVSIVPIWIQCLSGSLCRPLPIYKILSDIGLRRSLSQTDFERVTEVQKMVTETMLNTSISLDQAQKRYYSLPSSGYHRQALSGEFDREVPIGSLDPSRKTLLRLFSEAKKIVFLGDSITEGTKNGGYPWFEPLSLAFSDHEFINHGLGGETTKTLLLRIDEVLKVEADLFVVALGANDVRYRDPTQCAMNETEFVDNAEKIAEEIKSRYSNAKIVFIGAWPAFDNDKYSKLEPSKRDEMINLYNKALEKFCLSKGYLYIEASRHIHGFLKTRVTDDYILDHIHPNAQSGIKLYANVVLFGDPQNWRIR